jgi:hypothetical protein
MILVRNIAQIAVRPSTISNSPHRTQTTKDLTAYQGFIDLPFLQS